MTRVDRPTCPPVLLTFAIVAGSAKGACAECPYTSTGMDAATRCARRFSATVGRAVLRASRPSAPQRGRMSLRKSMTWVSRERAVSLRYDKASAGRGQFTPRLDLSQRSCELRQAAAHLTHGRLLSHVWSALTLLTVRGILGARGRGLGC